MTAYIATAIFMWMLSALEIKAAADLRRYVNLISIIIFVSFAGLRFETGFDWLAYEETFNEAPTLFDLAIRPAASISFTPMEPLYALLNIVIKTLGNDLQLLFFVVAAFNGLVIYSFIKKFGHYPSFCLAIYFCWAYLTAQMTLVRQSLASSLILIGIMLLLNNRRVIALLVSSLSLGFHVSALIFSPVLLLTRVKPQPWLILAIVITGYFFYFFSDGLVQFSLELVKPFLSEIRQEKIEFYIAAGNYQRSLASFLYALINSLVLFLSYKHAKASSWSKPTVLFVYLSLLLLCSQLYVGQLPVIWNRVQPVVIVTQICVLSTFLKRFSVFRRGAYEMTIAVCSITVLTYQLSNPRMLPFLPYYSYLEYVFTGDTGDGRERLEESLSNFDPEELREK